MEGGEAFRVENLTVLFTDAVDSTATATNLSPDDAEAHRRRHFSVLRQPIAEYGGTEVKSLGDGLMVVFASASAALSCAVAMQQGVDHDNRTAAVATGLRVGLSGGEMTVEDGDYYGDAVIEAARLCALCDGGQILAADVVRLTAGRRSPHTCRAVGEMVLKGFVDPVEVVDVHWDPLGERVDELPLPVRLQARPDAGVVGRTAEIADMIAAYERVSGGHGREVLLVSGEPGQGKTTLVAEAARAAHAAGARVLFGHCEEDLAPPYQLFVEVLGHYVTHAPEDELAAHVAAHGPDLARLVPALARRLPDLPPPAVRDVDTERYLLFEAAVAALDAAAERRPVVLVLDDLQWADTGSLQLLRQLVAGGQTSPLLILATHRSTDLPRSHPLVDALAALHRQAGVASLELRGLAAPDVASLMAATAGHQLDTEGLDLAAAVWRETDGNPFFVSEVLRHLAETGAIERGSDGRWTATGTAPLTDLPQSLRTVIGARVGRLGDAAERMLTLAAVIGRDFDLDVLARAARASEDEVIDVLDAASRAALVRELDTTPGRCSFAHALVQHTLYAELGPSRRGLAHRRVAEALEELCGERPERRIGELARHWEHAVPPDPTKVLVHTRRAADTALAALAPNDAVLHYTRALELVGAQGSADEALAVDLAIGLGTGQRQTGDPGFHQTLLDAAHRAEAMGDAERTFAALLATDRGFATSIGNMDLEKVALLQRTADRLPDAGSTRALVLAMLCSELAYGSPLDRRRALAADATALARATGDDAVLVRVLNLTVFSLFVPPLLDELAHQCVDALERAERLDDPMLQFWAAAYGELVALASGDVDEMHRRAAIATAIVERLDQPFLWWWETYTRALRAQLRGDTDAFERLVDEAFEIGTRSGQPDAELFFLSQSFFVASQRGAGTDVIPLVEQAVSEAQHLVAFTARSSLAAAYVDAGRLDDARRVLREFAALDYRLPDDALWLSTMVQFATAAVGCGDQLAALALHERLAPWEGQVAASGLFVVDTVSNVLGGLTSVLGRYAEADAHYERAAAFNARAGASYFTARTSLDWARSLVARGEPDRARPLLLDGRALSEANGYPHLLARADAALAAL